MVGIGPASTSAHLSSSDSLGTLGTFFQLLLVVGILYAYCCGYARNVTVTTLLCGTAPVVFALIMSFVPESPLYYVIKKNEEAAKKSMQFFRGPDYDVTPEINAFKVSATLSFAERYVSRRLLESHLSTGSRVCCLAI